MGTEAMWFIGSDPMPPVGRLRRHEGAVCRSVDDGVAITAVASACRDTDVGARLAWHARTAPITTTAAAAAATIHVTVRA
jgi:hypothetical protein